jgi:hypothetical protein
LVLKQRGGAKRKKGSDEGEPKGRIPEFMGAVEVKPSDPIAVQSAINDGFDITKWLGEMPLPELEQIKDVMTQYERSGHSDFVIKAFAKHFKPIVDMEVIHINTQVIVTKTNRGYRFP